MWTVVWRWSGTTLESISLCKGIAVHEGDVHYLAEKTSQGSNQFHSSYDIFYLGCTVPHFLSHQGAWSELPVMTLNIICVLSSYLLACTICESISICRTYSLPGCIYGQELLPVCLPDVIWHRHMRRVTPISSIIFVTGVTISDCHDSYTGSDQILKTVNT